MDTNSIQQDALDPIVNCLGKRNFFLQSSDFIFMPDSKVDPSTIDEWKIYRQSLRDLPDQDPNWGTDSVSWPVAPVYKKIAG